MVNTNYLKIGRITIGQPAADFIAPKSLADMPHVRRMLDNLTLLRRLKVSLSLEIYQVLSEYLLDGSGRGVPREYGEFRTQIVSFFQRPISFRELHDIVGKIKVGDIPELLHAFDFAAMGDNFHGCILIQATKPEENSGCVASVLFESSHL